MGTANRMYDMTRKYIIAKNKAKAAEKNWIEVAKSCEHRKGNKPEIMAFCGVNPTNGFYYRCSPLTCPMYHSKKA